MIERFLRWATEKVPIGFIALILTLTLGLAVNAVAQGAESETAPDQSAEIVENAENLGEENLNAGVKSEPETEAGTEVSGTVTPASDPAAQSGPFSKYGTPDTSDPELLVLRLSIGSDIVLSNELLAYQHGRRVSVALGEFANLIEFPILVNPEQGRASGWFLTLDRKFDLDLAAGKVEVDGRILDLPPAPLVEIVDGDIYVDTKVLSDWFPLELIPSIRTLNLNLKPGTPLPIQSRLEREKRRENAQRPLIEDTEIAAEKFEKEWWAVPSLDFNYIFSTSGGGDQKSYSRHRYSVLGEGDLGKMTANLFLSGTDAEISNIRGTLTKEDPSGRMLGPFHAKTLVMGDIGAPKTPFVRSQGQEKGLRIQNSDIFTDRLFDKTSFGGNLPQGWDVELYQNGILIDAADIKEDGRYDFDDVPLFFGPNSFEIVSYGPQGQRKVKETVLNFDPRAIKKGQIDYDIVVTQKGKGVFEPLVPSKQVDRDSFHFVSQVSRGLTDNVSLRASFSSEEFSEKRFNHFNLGTVFTGFGFFGRTDWTHDLKGGDAAKLLLQRAFGPVSVRFGRTQYWNFLSDPSGGQATDQKSDTDFAFFTSSRRYKFIPAITANLEYRKSVRKTSSDQIIRARLSTRISKMHLNHNLTHKILKNTGPARTTMAAGFQASLNLSTLILRAGLGYEIEPKLGLRAASMSGTYEFNDDISLILGVDHSLGKSDYTSWKASMSWDAGYLNLTPAVTYDSDNAYTAVMVAKFGLSHEPRNNRVIASSDRRPGSGAVSARVFLDNNANQIFDDGDEVLNSVKLKASTGGRKNDAVTDESGVGMITNITGGGITVIEIDERSIEDPFWLPGGKIQTIVGRPGTTQAIDFPIVNTGEIDGTVYLDNGDGSQREMGGVEVILVDKDGETVKTVRTAYDGFYLFTLVKPGRYTVQIPKTGNRQRDFLVQPSKPFDVSGAGEVIAGLEFLVQTKSDLALRREIELRRELDEEQALTEDSLERIPVVLPRRSDRRVITNPLPVENSPVVTPAPTPTAPVAPAATQEIEPRTGMHLASYRSREAAEAGWNDIRARHVEIMGSYTHSVSEVDLEAKGGVYFRLSALTDQEPAAARSVCAQLQQRDQYCAVSAV